MSNTCGRFGRYEISVFPCSLLSQYCTGRGITIVQHTRIAVCNLESLNLTFIHYNFIIKCGTIGQHAAAIIIPKAHHCHVHVILTFYFFNAFAFYGI